MTETDRLLEVLYPVLKEKVGHMPLCKAMEIADALLAKGILTPPVKIGQTVYYAIEEIEGYDDYVGSYEAQGVAFIQGKWYVFEGPEDCYEVGSPLCKLTREEAEELLNGQK